MQFGCGGFGFSAYVLRENSRQVGHALGLGSTFHTPPSAWVVSERAAIRLCRLSSSISLMRDSIVFIERLLTGIVRHSRFPFAKKIEARQRRGRPFFDNGLRLLYPVAPGRPSDSQRHTEPRVQAMSDNVTAIKGFADLFSPDSDAFTHMEAVAREIFPVTAFTELRTPILERTELFCRGIGTETTGPEGNVYLPRSQGPFPDLAPRSDRRGYARVYRKRPERRRRDWAALFTIDP